MPLAPAPRDMTSPAPVAVKPGSKGNPDRRAPNESHKEGPRPRPRPFSTWTPSMCPQVWKSLCSLFLYNLHPSFSPPPAAPHPSPSLRFKPPWSLRLGPSMSLDPLRGTCSLQHVDLSPRLRSSFLLAYDHIRDLLRTRICLLSPQHPPARRLGDCLWQLAPERPVTHARTFFAKLGCGQRASVRASVRATRRLSNRPINVIQGEPRTRRIRIAGQTRNLWRNVVSCTRRGRRYLDSPLVGVLASVA
ncbi:hypothetical protein IWX92DRAFT_389890 [Phyllosticta citricarpa]